tara:strand:- start:173 stop:427 length:255 start_codon:yes stop_codon:yes gene_type:complete
MPINSQSYNSLTAFLIAPFSEALIILNLALALFDTAIQPPQASVLKTARLFSIMAALHGSKVPESTAGSFGVTDAMGVPDPFTM